MSPVSVVLPVYNGARYLKETIESVLNQSYQNFELIIINDGSSDNSQEIIEKYSSNPKIVIVHQNNMGLAKTLNKAISISKYDLIARQDQDDISLPDRFIKQVEFLDNNLEYGIIGSFAQIIEENKLVNRFLCHPTTDKEIKTFLIFDTPFVHSSVMFRKNVFENSGKYLEDPNLQPPEDYELWSRIAFHTKMFNLDQVLLQYRELSSSMSRTMSDKFKKNIIIHNLSYCSKITKKMPNYDIPYLFHFYFPPSKTFNLFSISKQYFSIFFTINSPFDFLTNKWFYWHLKCLLKKYIKFKLGK